VAAELLKIFGCTRGVVDADWYVEEEHPKKYLRVDREKAGLHGIAPAAIADAVRLATMGSTAGLLHQELKQESVPIVMRLNKAERVDLDRIRRMRVLGANGAMVAISELSTVVDTREERIIYHKNLMPVTYVTADVAGEIESPVYAVLAVGPEIEKYKPYGYTIEQYVAQQPFDSSR